MASSRSSVHAGQNVFDEIFDKKLKKLNIVTFNLHGFNQGVHTVRDMMLSDNFDIFILQEHWLTPSNLYKFNDNFPEYMCFGSSAMRSDVESGVMRGRPYGGVMTLVSNKFMNCTQLICSDDRYVIVIVGDLMIINVYLPCVGTTNRSLIYEEVLENIAVWIEKYSHVNVILGGDLNDELDDSSPVSRLINQFAETNGLNRCDKLFLGVYYSTYYNESLKCQSTIDFFLTSNDNIVTGYNVIDPLANLSDHRPVVINCVCLVDHNLPVTKSSSYHDTENPKTSYLRWDRAEQADLAGYYEFTRVHLMQILSDLCDAEKYGVSTDMIDCFYNRIIKMLQDGAVRFVPRRYKNFFKYWWNQELSELKEKSITSFNLWKEAGRPRSGPVFNRYRSDKSAYKLGIKRQRHEDVVHYTNDLHDALLKKEGVAFWKCWKSKFESGNCSVSQVSGITDIATIAENFATHFAKSCTSNTSVGADKLRDEYMRLRKNYYCDPDNERYKFDAEVVETAISKLKRGKAAGLDSITSEHLQFSHPLLPCVLAMLFNFMIRLGHVPSSFGRSYTIPLLKGGISPHGKLITADDFRGISISPVLSKVLEHCILVRYKNLFQTSANQFGFKKGSGCPHAIYALRCVTEHYIQAGSTVNICALDLAKAFDRMSHCGLFIKLMEKRIPSNLLTMLERWFSSSMTCVKWRSVFSTWFNISCGIRQGGVLSPYLFAIYIDSLVNKVALCGYGCYVRYTCVSILLYADDILLLAPSVRSLQLLLGVCEIELKRIDMSINVKKSSCMRIGPRSNVHCSCITTCDGAEIPWSDSLRYLGVYITAGHKFCCSLKEAKKSFYRAFNSIFGKIGRAAHENVVIELLKAKCLPSLYYGLEACPINKSQIKSLNFVLNSTFRKIFVTMSYDIANECIVFFNCLVFETIYRRKLKFLTKLHASETGLCTLFAKQISDELAAVYECVHAMNISSA